MVLSPLTFYKVTPWNRIDIMDHFRCVFAIALGLWAAPAFSATYWVGSSAACTGSNVHPTLPAALLSAALNGTQSDEIRLTNTVTYSGSAGKVTLTDWSPSSAGSLTIAGGYPDCFTTPSGRTNFGNTTGVAVTVGTSSQSESNVRLRRLNIRSAATGLSATGGASVILDDSRIGDHDTRGIVIDGGAFVDIQANSIVEVNGDVSATGWGGGVYCNGANSEVTLRGRLRGNSASKGGNAYLVNGCFMTLMGGSMISANKIFGPGIALQGGGIYVDSGGELLANGGSERVSISNTFAVNGAGVYVNGTGRATLINTFFQGNEGEVGTVIYAVNGGTSSPQVIMDRASSCPFLISCSEMEGNRAETSIVYVDNSFVRISRTIIELSTIWTGPEFKSLIHGTNGALIRLGHVGMYRNTTDAVFWNQGAQFEVQNATIARNSIHVSSGTPPPSGALLQQGASTASTIIQKSIIADTSGFDLQSGVLGTPCLLLDGAAGDLSPSFYYSGTAQFINAASGDFRQTSASPGVDMCNGTSSFFWASTRDIEYQTLPVNDANNDQGSPGQADGYYDAGYDENHLNVGEDYFTLTAAKQGDGSGSIVSVPLGIACGSDCNEDYFNGTLVELYANASTGSVFDGWLGCPLSSGNVCFISVTQDATVTARFAGTSPGDEIFADSFEASL